MTTERCIDGSPHKFVFKEQRMVEAGYRRWIIEDTYFCEKCLKYEKTERDKPAEPSRSW